jgi:hypothetical protein
MKRRKRKPLADLLETRSEKLQEIDTERAALAELDQVGQSLDELEVDAELGRVDPGDVERRRREHNEERATSETRIAILERALSRLDSEIEAAEQSQREREAEKAYGQFRAARTAQREFAGGFESWLVALNESRAGLASARDKTVERREATREAFAAAGMELPDLSPEDDEPNWSADRSLIDFLTEGPQRPYAGEQAGLERLRKEQQTRSEQAMKWALWQSDETLRAHHYSDEQIAEVHRVRERENQRRREAAVPYTREAAAARLASQKEEALRSEHKTWQMLPESQEEDRA